MSDERTALEKQQMVNEALPLQPGYPKAVEYADGYNNSYGSEEEGAQLNLSKWINGLKKRKWLIASIIVLVTSMAAFEMFRTRDFYKASAIIGVGKDDTRVIKSGSDEVVIQVSENVKTKAFFLESNELILDLIIDLKLDQKPEVFEPRKRSFRETVEAFKSAVKNRIYPVDELKEVKILPDTASFPESDRTAEYKITDSDSWRLEPYVWMFKKMYKVEPYSEYIRISFTHPDPVLASTICNRVAQIFVQRNYDGRNERYGDATNWLNRTTKELKARVEKAEKALVDYVRDHPNMLPDGKGTYSASKLLNLHNSVSTSETDLIIKGSLYDEVKKGRVALLPDAFTDARIAELQKKLEDLTVQSAQLDVNYGPDNPLTIEVQQQISTIQKQINTGRKALEEKLKSDYELAVRNEQSFRDALEEVKTQNAQENQDSVQYEVIKQEVGIAKSLYQNFLIKSNNANFDLAQQENNLRVIEPSRVPRITMGPQRMKWLGVGFLISVVLGFGVALLLELLDRSIQSTDDINRHLQLPTLASIPTIDSVEMRSLKERVKEKPKIFSNQSSQGPLIAIEGGLIDPDDNSRISLDDLGDLENRTPAAEAYHLLTTSLLLSVESGFSKTLLFTSNQPGEGKTTTTINTAIGLAQLGKSVLIIDCDLRTPGIHTGLGIKTEAGLSTYLANQSKLNRVIYKMEMEGLSVLPSGPIPNNPVRLIGSKRMREMIAELTMRFDFILIDSPPMIALADPVILSALVDGVIIVINEGKSNRDAVRRTKQELLKVGANILGVVLNNDTAGHTQYKGAYSVPIPKAR